MTGHQHVLVKDPLRLGWRCDVPGCRHFKPAGEFDGIAILPDDTESRRPPVASGDFRNPA